MNLSPPERRDRRASDGERRQVIATLQAACVEGRLNLDEYGQRVEDALVARTRAQLEALLLDLPAETSTSDERAIAATNRAVARGGRVSSTLAVLASAHRSGFWRPAEKASVGAALRRCHTAPRSA